MPSNLKEKEACLPALIGGKRAPYNKTKDSDIEMVKNHIQSFPVMESHYRRKCTKRQYLDSKLSIAKMLTLYKEICKKDNLKPVSLITYRRIFCTNYNLSFFIPKKDQCQTCTQFETADLEKRNNSKKITRVTLCGKTIATEPNWKIKREPIEKLTSSAAHLTFNAYCRFQVAMLVQCTTAAKFAHII